MPSLIEIVPAQPSWRTDFETLKITVMSAAPVGSRVHHIGSTAVPGLAAKDVIDILFWRVLDRLDYWLTQARLWLAHAVCGLRLDGDRPD